jgi:hypothetical protein
MCNKSMALHIFRMLNSPTLHIIRSVPSNISRGNVTRKPVCDFQLFPKNIFFWSHWGCYIFHPQLSTSYSKSLFRADVPSSCFVQSKCHAGCTLHHIPNPVRSLCYGTRLHTFGSVFSYSNVPLHSGVPRNFFFWGGGCKLEFFRGV